MFNDENEQDDSFFFERVSDSCDLNLLDNNNNNSVLIDTNTHPDNNEKADEKDDHHSSVVNIDNYICNFVEKVKLIYYSNDIDKLDQLLKDTFPQFYLLISTNIFYFIQKLKMFKLLWIGKFNEAKDFYLNELFPLVKETKKTKWIIKNKFFLQIIDSPISFRDNKYLEKYLPQFENILNKSLRQYLKKDSSNFNFIKRNETTISFDTNKANMNINQSATSPNLESTTHSATMNNNYSIIINQLNNNEDFSDFEEELGFDIKINPYEGKETDPETISNSSKRYSLFQNSSYLLSKARPTNCLFTLSKIIRPKKEPTSNKSLYKILPSLRAFKPHYTKRENIDKKIVRRFRQFIVDLIKKKAFNPDDLGNSNFWILLINGDLFPPINYFDEDTKEQIVFKSLNSNYLLWIFSKNGIKNVYDKFLKCQGAHFVNSLIVDYMIDDECEKRKIESYVNNLPFIFDISLLPSDEASFQLSSLFCSSKYKRNTNHKNNGLDRSRGFEGNDKDQMSNAHSSAIDKDSED